MNAMKQLVNIFWKFCNKFLHNSDLFVAELTIMAILASQAYCMRTKKSNNNNSHLDLMLSSLSTERERSKIFIWSCPFGSHYINDLRPSLKWCRNKRQFKDISSSTCLNGSERRALDPNSWGAGFYANWGTIFFVGFFYFRIVKPLMPILSFLPILCVREKL